MHNHIGPHIPRVEYKEEPSPIIIVIGRMCSGKSTFAQQLAQHHIIDVGDIVREITRTSARIQKRELDQYIIPILVKRIKQFRPVAIVGLRQRSILNAIEREFGHENFDFVYLQVSEEERLRRFIERFHEKDFKDLPACDQGYAPRTHQYAHSCFLDFEQKDDFIGLDVLIDHVLNNRVVTIIEN